MVDAEVVAEEDSMEALAMVPYQEKTRSKEKKQIIYDGPNQRLANIRIAIRATEKQRDKCNEKLKELKQKARTLAKLIEKIDQI